MNFLSYLVSVYDHGVYGRIVLLMVAWLIWPGMMFLIGGVLESRLVPIGKSQSKMFFPGDLAIGIAIVAIISMYDKTGVDIPLVGSAYWWITLGVIMIVIALRLRRSDCLSYPKRSARSPSKIAHDLIGYYASPLVLIGLGIPQLAMLGEHGVFEATRMGWFVALMAAVLYLFCTALDIMTFYDSSDIALRHPEDWQPIWRTRRNAK